MTGVGCVVRNITKKKEAEQDTIFERFTKLNSFRSDTGLE